MNPIILEILGNKYCKGCILNKRDDYITVRNETIKINTKYVLDKIRILFVAESPPMGFLRDLGRYFYAPGEVKYGGLFYHMMSALYENEMKAGLKSSKERFLERFKGKGFYLIDMVKCPVDKLPKREKRKAIVSCSKYLNKELGSLYFEKAIFIGKGSFKDVKAHLDLSFDYSVIPLPFGADRNVQRFREGLIMDLEIAS